MLIRLLIAIFIMGTGGNVGTERALPVQPEPDVSAAVVHSVYLPMLTNAGDEVTGATSPIYGYATPHRRTYDVPFYNWRAYKADCDNANFWPMVRGQTIEPGMIDACDNGQRMLMIYNEPELWHFSATPRQAVDMVSVWRYRWTGPIACCGNFYGQVGGYIYSGLEWMLAFIEDYHIIHGTVPPIDAVHLHVYQGGGVNAALLKEWRALADAYGWQLIVSESGVSTALTPEEAAEALPAFLAEVEAILQPDVLMWFSDYLQPWVLKDGVPWHILNLTNADGSLTPVGSAWYRYIDK